MDEFRVFDGFLWPAATVTVILATDSYVAGEGRQTIMKKLNSLIWKLRIVRDTRGQDLIEYALMAGFVAVAAGAIVPGVAESIKTIFGKVNNVMTSSSSQG